jgi:hypothetical protein
MTELISPWTGDGAPASLRTAIAADLAGVKPLRSPLARAMAVAPFGIVLLVAAPLTFELRSDVARLGSLWSWGASALQAALGLGLVTAGLREAVPGRAWSSRDLTLLVSVPLALFVGVTLTAWWRSPTTGPESWWLVLALCALGAASSALPAVALGAVLAHRAFPSRPGVAGALVGLGAGLMADAGWRLFCHDSQPEHVLPAHLGAVVLAMLAGAAVMAGLGRRRE